MSLMVLGGVSPGIVVVYSRTLTFCVFAGMSVATPVWVWSTVVPDLSWSDTFTVITREAGFVASTSVWILIAWVDRHPSPT